MNQKIIQLQNKYNVGKMCLFSYGNSKLPKHTLIVNITSATNCPSAKLGFCQHVKVCYALKCERIYKAYKNKNLIVEQWMKNWSYENLIELLTSYIENASTKIKYIRINEAGDFPHQESVILWERIAKYFSIKKNIKTYGYTCREDLDFSSCKYLIVNSSSYKIKAKRYFMCVDKSTFEQLTIKDIKCRGNCRICKLCYDSPYVGTIYCRQH